MPSMISLIRGEARMDIDRRFISSRTPSSCSAILSTRYPCWVRKSARRKPPRTKDRARPPQTSSARRIPRLASSSRFVNRLASIGLIVPPSALHGAGGHARDDRALPDEVEDGHRGGDNNHVGADELP